MIRAWARGGQSTGAVRVRRAVVLVLPGVWVLGVVLWELCRPSSGQLLQLLAAAPAIACAGTGRRQCVLLGGVCALLAMLPFGAVEPAAPLGTRATTCGAILAVVGASYLTAGRRRRLLRELARSREVATATQRVLLRPLPSRIEGLTLAAGHLSASEGAVVGGDLYEVTATRHGVRAVIGDVRGHGLPALGSVAALLGSFREVVHDEPELTGVLRKLERSQRRQLCERADSGQAADGAAEEFVTLLLVEVAQDGAVTALNCGHPWPYRIGGGEPRPGPAVAPLASVEPLPPLGLFPLPDALPTVGCGRLGPGEALFLHTDGAADARNGAGEFFPLEHELAAAVRAAGGAPSLVVAGVREALLRHCGGRLTDDVALVVLRNDPARVPAQQPSPRTPTPVAVMPRGKRGSLR